MNAQTKLEKHIPSLISLWRKNKSSQPLTPKEVSSLSKALLTLQRGLTGDRSLAGVSYMDSDELLGAYLLYYWPVTYMQISSVVHPQKHLFDTLCSKRNSEDKTLKVLDLGSGPGPASAALLDNLKAKDISLTLFDYSAKALALADRIIKKDFSNAEVKVKTVNLEKDITPLLDDKYDIVIMSHALNELWKGDKDCLTKRKALLDNIFAHLCDDGYFIINEPAVLEASRNLISVRDMLVKDNIKVVSPCVAVDEACDCPALKAGPNHTCHCENIWNPCKPVSDLAKGAGLDRTSVKMSYFIFTKQCDLCKNDGLYRVVSDGMLNKAGRLRFLLCNTKERIALSAKKDDRCAESKGFFDLHRYTLINLVNPELRGDKDNKAFGVTEDTIITVIEKPSSL